MKKYVVLYLLFILSNRGFSQLTSVGANVELPSIAMLDIEPDNSTVNLSLPHPSEAGSLDLVVQLNNEKWINYTCALPLLKFRRVLVKKEYGSIPAGTKLSLIVSNAVSGSGLRGSGAGEIEVPAVGQREIISTIGSSFTNSGVNKGHSISYKLEVTNVSLLSASTGTNLGLTFTIMDY